MREGEYEQMCAEDNLQHPINYSTLQELEEAVASGIPEIMVDLLNTFTSDSQETFQTLTRALSNGDIKLIEISAHSLKSSAATFGAEALSALFARIEQAAHTGGIQFIPPMVAEGERKLNDVVGALRVERTRLLQSE
jgi:HPt (histidine-containing phosphotransfer) domain-containing protein